MVCVYSTRSPYTPQSGSVHRFADLLVRLDEITAAATPFLEALWEYRRNGRPGYPLKPLMRAYAVSFLRNLPHTNALVRWLQEDPELRSLCGFGDALPHRTTFNRFIKRVARYQRHLEPIMEVLGNRIKTILPDLGDTVAVDSTAVRTHSNPNRKVVSDPRPAGASNTRQRPRRAARSISLATRSMRWPMLSTAYHWPRW